MPREDMLNRLQEIAQRISKVHPAEDAEVAFVNLIAGAIYALHQAAKLDYDDNRANPNPDVSKQEFRRSVINISQGLLPEDAWLAGFYLNSALLRMAPLNERINKQTHTTYNITNIRRLVNKIKHEPDAQMGQMWHVTLIDAVDALEVLCKRLEESLGKERV
jgi:hypothetical protein